MSSTLLIVVSNHVNVVIRCVVFVGTISMKTSMENVPRVDNLTKPKTTSLLLQTPKRYRGYKTQKKAKERERKHAEANARKNLANVRVIQRNLVYLTNLALSAATEEVLKRPDYFGRFGKIKKIVVNRNNVYQGPQGSSVSAYITYFRNKDAHAAIKAVDGIVLDGRLLRASFGTTKYCSYFLRNVRCPNPDCMYLHELGNDVDSFTKEDMAQGKHLLSNITLNPEEPLSPKQAPRRDLARSHPSGRPKANNVVCHCKHDFVVENGGKT